MQHEKVRAQSAKPTDVFQVSQQPIYIPVRCPACSRIENVSDKQDLESFMERKFQKCMASSDPVCKVATSSSSVQVLKDRIYQSQKDS